MQQQQQQQQQQQRKQRHQRQATAAAVVRNSRSIRCVVRLTVLVTAWYSCMGQWDFAEQYRFTTVTAVGRVDSCQQQQQVLDLSSAHLTYGEGG
jgi:hypothetical protein